MVMFVVKFAKTVRNNPKKSIAGAALLSWATVYVKDKYVALMRLRAECETAAKLGRQPLNQFDSAKRVTVLLNPSANGGKATKMFEKYAEPILHLSGLNVHLVRLHYEGEAKKLMSVVDDTDMIICAGGDGTLSEIVTGLLRRPDNDWKRIPIGVIPLGKSNTLCRQLLPNADHEKQPHFISSAATAITKEQLTPVDVMQIEGSSGKTVYAVSSIRWGNYCDLQEKAKKRWYLGPLKSYSAFLFSFVFGKSPSSRMFDISYSDPQEPMAFVENAVPQSQAVPMITGTSVLTNFFLRLFPWLSTSSNSSSTEEKSVEIEEADDDVKWHEIKKSSIEFFVRANTHLNLANRKKASIIATLESDSVSFSDFISKGPFTVKNDDHYPVKVAETFEANTLKLSSPLNESDKQYISIDNDRYEAMDISIKLLSNCIKMIHEPAV